MLFTRRSFLQQLVATTSMACRGSRAFSGSEKGNLATNGSPLTEGAAHQIAIADVEEMPNIPQPFKMWDWKQVAKNYDTLVFDLNAKGEYLPLIWIDQVPYQFR